MPNSIKGFPYITKYGELPYPRRELYRMYCKYLLTDLQLNHLGQNRIKMCNDVIVSIDVEKVLIHNHYQNFADCT